MPDHKMTVIGISKGHLDIISSKLEMVLDFLKAQNYLDRTNHHRYYLIA